MIPFPVNGLVPYLGQVVPVQSCMQRAPHGFTYCVHTRLPDRTLVVHAAVPHAVLLASIGAVAHYAVGQTLVLHGRYALEVGMRKWSFRKGTVIYSLNRPGAKMGAKVFTQEELFRAVDADDVPDTYARAGRNDIERTY
ncbi:MAG: hypothetical protein WBB32_15680 [Flavobacteriales bacterium]|nr:hypothetical protein [Flavobacteriales bacterium]